MSLEVEIRELLAPLLLQPSGAAPRGAGPPLGMILAMMKKIRKKKKKLKKISVQVFNLSDLHNAIVGLDAIAAAKIIRGGQFGYLGHELQHQLDMD